MEARGQLLLASHLAGIGQASGTGVGLVHAIGHALGTRGRLPHGTALAAVLPEVLTFYARAEGLRDRELALVGVALGAASPADRGPTPRGRGSMPSTRSSAAWASGRRSRRSASRRRSMPVIALDAVDDAAIANSPRLPTRPRSRPSCGPSPPDPPGLA